METKETNLMWITNNTVVATVKTSRLMTTAWAEETCLDWIWNLDIIYVWCFIAICLLLSSRFSVYSWASVCLFNSNRKREFHVTWREWNDVGTEIYEWIKRELWSNRASYFAVFFNRQIVFSSGFYFFIKMSGTFFHNNKQQDFSFSLRFLINRCIR